jgi:ABC-type Fe3+ transport system substrate-binding protein
MRGNAFVAAAVFLVLTPFASAARAADPALVSAARSEGRVVWYTTLIVDQFVRPAVAAFEKKYGIKVEFVRADPVDIALRISNEGKSGHPIADVFDGFSQVVNLDRDGLVLHWLPEATKHFPEGLYSPTGSWVASNLYVLTPGFNTSLVPKGTEPRSYDDLLDVKWKGKIAWSRSPAASAGPGVVGLILADRGEEKGMAYLRALAGQNITGVDATARQVLDQVMAGEYPLTLGIFNHHAVISAGKGAPVDWIAMEPAMAVLSVISMTKDAPHPNAGKLLVDYLVSSEGQAFFRDADYLPVDPQTPARVANLTPDGGHFRAIYFTPEDTLANMPRWRSIFEDLFR